MAGLGSRFTEAGFNLPKYEIEVNNKTLFEWSMESLEEFKKEFFIFIVRKDTRSKTAIEKLISKANINNFKVIYIDFQTNGQATTAMLANNLVESEDEVLIFNIDTHITPGIIKKEDFLKGDGVIHTFNATGNHWSFAKTNNKGEVIEVTEKIKISNNASIGLYYFRKWSLFKDYYLKYSDIILNTYNEVFIAPLYNFIINDFNVYIVSINENEIHVLGTPKEVESFQKVLLKYWNK
jgi:choline kinase